MAHSIVIIGAGQAGGEAAVTLRTQGFEGPVVLIGDEPFVPYERPPLSKQLLAGELEPERTFIKRPEYYAEHGIEVRLGVRATAIDRAAHEVALETGETLPYGRLLIATGARVRRLDIPGADLAGVHYLRTITDSLAIRDDLGSDARLVIVGGGYIGLEVAAVATKLGCRVTVLEALDRVMNRVVAPEVSAFFEDLHRRHGVDLRTDTAVREIAGPGRVERVICADGSEIEADAVVIGVGIVPNVELAQAAGLEVDNGIVVDEFARTSDADIYAAGDVTNHPNAIIGGRLRLESVQNAANQAQAAARAMCGNGTPYAEVPWFWSDQYGLKLQMAGISAPDDQVVIRGDPASERFSAIYLRDGVIVAINTINAMRDFMAGKRLIAGHVRADPATLADPEFPLKNLL